jgi:glutathione S-transferase
MLSPSGLVPLLEHGTLRIGDSLAIAEYLAEQFPALSLWPADTRARALARAASCEMHAGFGAMRNSMNMNIRARFVGFGRSPEVERDVQRVQALWRGLRTEFGMAGPYLCGGFGVVDAMFAPVVTRFRTYDVKLDRVCAAYAEAVLTHPAVKGWLDKAAQDDFRIPAYEYTVG